MYVIRLIRPESGAHSFSVVLMVFGRIDRIVTDKPLYTYIISDDAVFEFFEVCSTDSRYAHCLKVYHRKGS